MTIEQAYELADQYSTKTNGYTRISIERWNFNHKDESKHPVEYRWSSQARMPETFSTIEALIEHLKELLA